jgi:hypothetical protein
MTKKKNIQASNQNVINSQDGTMNSTNGSDKNGNVSNNQFNDFQQKANPGILPGRADTRNK